MFGKKRRYHEDVWNSLSDIGLGKNDFPAMSPINHQIDQAYYSDFHHCETALMMFYSAASRIKESQPQRFDDLYKRVQLHERSWIERQLVRNLLVLDWKRITSL